MTEKNVGNFKTAVKKRKALRQALDELAEIASALLPDGYMIAGFGLVETDVVEGEYISVLEPSNDVWTLDVMQDIASSANQKYQSCFGPCEPDQVVKAAFDKLLSSINGK